MKCPNCGVELNDGAAFCTSCGSQLSAENKPEAPAEAPNALDKFLDTLMDKLTPVAVKIKDFFSVKRNLIATGGVLAALLLVIIISSAVSSGNTGFTEYGNYYGISCNDDGNLVILNKGKMIETSIECTAESVASTVRSHDGSIMAIRVDNVIYYVKGNTLTKVDEDASSMRLATSGKAIAYISEGSSLYLYTIGGDSVKVEDDEVVSSYTISPDGKSLLYSIYDEDKNEYPVYYFNGKESVKIASNGNPCGVSNGGKYIYYSSVNDKGETYLYFYNKSKEEKTKLETIKSYYFNEDLSQVVILSEDMKTYISSKGKDAEKISSKAIFLISPQKTITINSIVPVDDFYGKYFSGDGAVYKIEKDADKTIKLVSNITSCHMSDDFETLYYTNKDYDLFVTKTSYGEKAKEKATEIAEEVSDFEVTSDCDLVYYISDDEAFVIKGNGSGEAKRVSSDDVDSSLVIDGKDNVYFICDGEFHAVKGKNTSVSIVEDYSYYWNLGGYLYVLDDDSCYYVKGTKVEKLFDCADFAIKY